MSFVCVRNIFEHVIHCTQKDRNCTLVINIHDQKPQLSWPMTVLLIFLRPLWRRYSRSLVIRSRRCGICPLISLFIYCHTSLLFTLYGRECQDSLAPWKPFLKKVLKNHWEMQGDHRAALQPSEEHRIGRSYERLKEGNGCSEAGHWANSGWAWHARLAPTDLAVWGML